LQAVSAGRGTLKNSKVGIQLAIGLDRTTNSGYSYGVTRCFQPAIVVLLTVAMLVIFISPAVPFPTTLRARHTVAPLHVTVCVPVLQVARAMTWRPVREALVSAHSPDVVDLTSARLC
jgi:hypothetical protein